MSWSSASEGWVDVTVPLRDGMAHWPGDPAVRIERVLDLDRGDAANVSVVSMGTHTGTHVDAPLHFIREADGIDAMPFSAAVGRARVIQVKDRESIRAEEIGEHGIRAGERVLFKTENSSRCWGTDGFVEDFVYLPHRTAEYLVERQVRTVGIDYLSVGGFRKDGQETHRTLLRGGIWLIEGLDLSEVEPGLHELVCLPLRILGGDGAPARALLRRISR